MALFKSCHSLHVSTYVLVDWESLNDGHPRIEMCGCDMYNREVH